VARAFSVQRLSTHLYILCLKQFYILLLACLDQFRPGLLQSGERLVNLRGCVVTTIGKFLTIVSKRVESFHSCFNLLLKYITKFDVKGLWNVSYS